MRRAVRMREEQLELLPLFTLLAQVVGQLPEQVRLDLLACAVTALMDATFDQKMAFFFNVFDNAGNGSFGGPFVVRVAMLFGETFYRLNMLPYAPHEEDLVDAVQRGFVDLNLKYETDSLSMPEAKRLLVTFLSHSFPLANSLAVKLGLPGMKAVIDIYGGPGGVPGGSLMGTYQVSTPPPSFADMCRACTGSNNTASVPSLSVPSSPSPPPRPLPVRPLPVRPQRNRMTAIGLLMKGMIGPTVCKYRVHVEHTRYRPQLETSHMQTIHERAFQMGEEDPLRTDYSRSVWISHRAHNALALTTIDI